MTKQATSVDLQQLDGKKLLGIAGKHSVLLDRKIPDGGDDVGFTSSELLLLAIGSCATAGIRKGLIQHGLTESQIKTRVSYIDNPASGPDLIQIEFGLPASISDDKFAAIKQNAQTGGVTSRFGQSLLIKKSPLQE